MNQDDKPFLQNITHVAVGLYLGKSLVGPDLQARIAAYRKAKKQRAPKI
jgi:hypothetical protein